MDETTATPEAHTCLDAGLIPVRMLNEYVYCPRLAYTMWVQGGLARNADTVEGAIRHKHVDQASGTLPAEGDGSEKIHARSVHLSSERLGITAKIDLVEPMCSGLIEKKPVHLLRFCQTLYCACQS